MCRSLRTGLTTDTDVMKDVKAFCIVATALRPSCVKARAGIKVMVARRVLQLGIALVEKSGAMERACSAVAERQISGCIEVTEALQYRS